MVNSTKKIISLCVLIIFIILLFIDTNYASIYSSLLSIIQFSLAIYFSDVLLKINTISKDTISDITNI